MRWTKEEIQIMEEGLDSFKDFETILDHLPGRSLIALKKKFYLVFKEDSRYKKYIQKTTRLDHPNKKVIPNGTEIHNWTVIEECEPSVHRSCQVICQCKCGNLSKIPCSTLRSGNSKGCKECSYIGKNKKVDHSGDVLHKLTLLERINHPRQKYKCRCECGNITVVAYSDMRCGTTKSCGCIRNGLPRKDLTGQKINMLTILSIEPNEPNEPIKYMCKCDCGNTKSIAGVRIRSGKTKSCGCHGAARLKEHIESTKLDLVGKTFGQLTVISEADRGDHRDRMFYCNCSCGTQQHKVRGVALNSGMTKSCGCRKRGSQEYGTIYQILDDQGVPKYIGQTVQYELENRLKAHINLSKRRKSKMAKWLTSIDYTPKIEPLIERVPIPDLDRLEEEYIKEYAKKYDLMNTVHNRIN